MTLILKGQSDLGDPDPEGQSDLSDPDPEVAV